MSSSPETLEKGINLNSKRQALKLGGIPLLILSFQTLGNYPVVFKASVAHDSLGIIYSDIGTSPLYVLNGIWGTTTAPSEEDVIGGISAIIWSLTLLPLLKYVRSSPSEDPTVYLTMKPRYSSLFALERMKVGFSFGHPTSQLNSISGEGGSFALFQGLFPPVDTDYDADRTLTGDSVNNETLSEFSGGRHIKRKYRWPLLVWVSYYQEP